MSTTDEAKRDKSLTEAVKVVEAKLNSGASIEDPAAVVISAAEKFYEFLDKAEKPKARAL